MNNGLTMGDERCVALIVGCTFVRRVQGITRCIKPKVSRGFGPGAPHARKKRLSLS